MCRPVSCPSTLPSNSKHSHRFPVHSRSLHWFPFIGFVKTRVSLPSCSHAMTGADGPNSVEVQQFAVHRQGVLRLLRHHKLSRENADYIQKIQKTVETPQEQLWTVPRILKFQKTVEYATGLCYSESRRPCMSDRYSTWTWSLISHLCCDTKCRQS